MPAAVRTLLIVFAKAPIAGAVKTRLGLAPESAAELHAAFVEDFLDSMAAIGASVELHTDTPTDAWPGLDVPRRRQNEGDLGLRMVHALADALQRGYGQAVVLGSDSPGLPRDHVRGLMNLDADVALGPAEDGGFWGVAARRVHPAMFAGVEWSAADTRARSLAAIRAAGLSAQEGAVWFDVDTAADLDRLLSLPDRLPRTRAWAARRRSS